MKKILSILLCLCSLLFFSCTEKENFVNNANGPQSEVYVNGVSMSPKSSAKSSPKSGSLLTYERLTSYHWSEPFDMFEKFPEFITPEGYYDDFLFTSDGQPFTLVMLYANGGYRHNVGIYWYDNGVYHEQELWVETDDIADGSWINFNGSSSGGVISRSNDNAGAYTITLPAGTKYGFYCHSITIEGNEILEGIRTPLPFGPVVAYNYKFYTEKTKNWSYMVAEYDDYAGQGKTTTQAMTTNANNWSIVGFEDRSITHPGCDRDYNDCVFAMYPQQSMYNPTAPSGNIEVDIHQQEHSDWGEIKTSVHIRTVSNVTIVLPIEEDGYVAPADDVAVRDYEVRCEYLTTAVAGLNVNITHDGHNTIITITGVTQEMLDQFDGELTIECHSYYSIISDEDLWTRLRNSSVVLSNPNADLTGKIHYKDDPKPDWIQL